MSGVMYAGKWRIKPSGRLPIFIRFIINSSFTKEIAAKNVLKNYLPNRTYLNYVMYWKAEEYNKFEKEVTDHLRADDGWFEGHYKRELAKSNRMYKKGLELEKVDWKQKSNAEIKEILLDTIEQYKNSINPWYTQYSIDAFFETAIEGELAKYISITDHDFRKYVLIFTDPKEATEVSLERFELLKMAKKFFRDGEKLDRLSKKAKKSIEKHLKKFAYINRGLATSKPYSFRDIVDRLVEMKKQVDEGVDIDNESYNASEEKLKNDFRETLKRIKPKKNFRKLINKARNYSYLRNRRVESFIRADFGASFAYAEVARRAKFNSDLIMEISLPEMLGALEGQPLPSNAEMKRRLKNYAMLVRNAKTELITDPVVIKKMEKEYYVDTKSTNEIHGRVACIGGIIRGRAKICMDKSDIGKIKKGDILVAQYTAPDFVPAMEKAAAIVADQGGLSSHAAIVSRELGVPCIIHTVNGTRIIKDNDLLEVDARKGIIKILKRAK